jgi:hypothetical protein
MEHIDFDTTADLGTLQRKYGKEIGMQVSRYYKSQLDDAAANALDNALLTQFDSYLGPTREEQPSPPPVRQPTHTPTTPPIIPIIRAVYATVTNSNEHNSVQPDKRPKEWSNNGGIPIVNATMLSVRAAAATERSANATNVRSATGSMDAAGTEKKHRVSNTIDIMIGSESREHARRVAEAQVQEECGLTAAPADIGYKHLYELEVSRRTDNIVKNRERRCRRRQNRTAERVGSPMHPTRIL